MVWCIHRQQLSSEVRYPICNCHTLHTFCLLRCIAAFVQGKKQLVWPCNILIYPRDNKLAKFVGTQIKVKRTTQRWTQERSHLDRSRSWHLRATAARNDIYLRAVKRWRRHATIRTVLAEWRTILSLWSPSSVRRMDVGMSHNSQRRNEPLHILTIIKLLKLPYHYQWP